MIHLKPSNSAQAAVIARSRQLTDYKWTPIRDIPIFIKSIGNTMLFASEQLPGFPYASEERNDKFVCENVSYESFLSAIPNPYSKLYQPGHAAFDACNYGIVCNGHVRYALDIQRRVSTNRWLDIPGMRKIKECGDYTVDEIRLCDVLHSFGKGYNHVALITDILLKDDGSVAEIEVSEAVRPCCKRVSYAVDDFYEKFKLFSLCRYEYLNDVAPLDEEQDTLLWHSGIEKISPKIAVDNGNKSNYLKGDEVIISVFIDGSDTVEILREGVLVEEIRVDKRAVLVRILPGGYYTVRLKNDGAYTEFCVCSAELAHSVEGNNITVYVNCDDKESEILYMDFRAQGKTSASLAKYEELTNEEKSSGIITRAIPSDGKNYKVYFKNKYGIWTQPMTKIR